MLSHADVEVTVEKKGVRIVASAATTAQTGVEMEALTAAAVAALTVYDMTKALDKSIEIQDLYLLEKTGGKSGDFRREEDVMINAAVLTISDSASAGTRADRSGPAVRERLEQLGWSVSVMEVIPDERAGDQRAPGDTGRWRPGVRHLHHRRHRRGAARRHAGGHARRAGPRNSRVWAS